jgi:hypothetical protein
MSAIYPDYGIRASMGVATNGRKVEEGRELGVTHKMPF